MGVDPWVDRGTCPPTFGSGGDVLCFVPLLFGGIFVLMHTVFIGRLEQFSLKSVNYHENY